MICIVRAAIGSVNCKGLGKSRMDEMPFSGGSFGVKIAPLQIPFQFRK
jgi:hypothetical protein